MLGKPRQKSAKAPTIHSGPEASISMASLPSEELAEFSKSNKAGLELSGIFHIPVSVTNSIVPADKALYDLMDVIRSVATTKPNPARLADLLITLEKRLGDFAEDYAKLKRYSESLTRKNQTLNDQLMALKKSLPDSPSSEDETEVLSALAKIAPISSIYIDKPHEAFEFHFEHIQKIISSITTIVSEVDSGKALESEFKDVLAANLSALQTAMAEAFKTFSMQSQTMKHIQEHNRRLDAYTGKMATRLEIIENEAKVKADELRKELAELMLLQESSRKKEACHEKMIAGLIQERNILISSSDELKIEAAGAVSNIQMLELSVDEKNARINELNKRANEAEQKLGEARANNKQLKTQIDTLKVSETQIHSQIKGLQAKNTELSAALATATKEKTFLAAEASSLKKELVQAKTEAASKSHTIAEQDKVVTAQQAELADLKYQLAHAPWQELAKMQEESLKLQRLALERAAKAEEELRATKIEMESLRALVGRGLNDTGHISATVTAMSARLHSAPVGFSYPHPGYSMAFMPAGAGMPAPAYSALAHSPDYSAHSPS